MSCPLYSLCFDRLAAVSLVVVAGSGHACSTCLLSSAALAAAAAISCSILSAAPVSFRLLILLSSVEGSAFACFLRCALALAFAAVLGTAAAACTRGSSESAWSEGGQPRLFPLFWFGLYCLWVAFSMALGRTFFNNGGRTGWPGGGKKMCACLRAMRSCLLACLLAMFSCYARMMKKVMILR